MSGKYFSKLSKKLENGRFGKNKTQKINLRDKIRSHKTTTLVESDMVAFRNIKENNKDVNITKMKDILEK